MSALDGVADSPFRKPGTYRVGRREAILPVGEAGRVRDHVGRFLARVSVEQPGAAAASICRAARGRGLFKGSRIASYCSTGADVFIAAPSRDVPGGSNARHSAHKHRHCWHWGGTDPDSNRRPGRRTYPGIGPGYQSCRTRRRKSRSCGNTRQPTPASPW